MKNLNWSFYIFLSASMISCVRLDPTKVSVSKTDGSLEEPSISPSPTPSPSAPSDDPSTDEPVQKASVETNGSLAPRSYVSQVLKEAFGSTVVTVTNLEVNLDNYINIKPGAFGVSCNPYSTYTGRDCGGVGGDFISNANSTFDPAASTVRQLNTSKVCEVILGRTENSAVYAIAKLIGEYSGTSATSYNVNLLNELNEANIVKLFGVFYRGRDITPEELSIYVGMNADLIAKSPTVAKVDRWRALALMMCESPDWGVL
ncbi:hypothetical protein AZI86_10745 [Bdellovibrio bacteriovorus]|uniref:Uncharacterized protein n=1 Tax=Bdellovibrio bacteriovorus TaxID=959 RepID=A0A150WL06_BDEBC|nr:hypothetical protein [Bdellovibrio bacteriovorus]KYG64681.1 hypothetical protein AZI86_10745 [Bdellovibrio bacteriovorus]